MAKDTPKPREGRFMGMPIPNWIFEDGTWLEGEEFCYPGGGMNRWAWAECEDGTRRRVKCGIADSFFSIPARIPGGAKGFLSMQNGGIHFTETKNQD